MPKDKSAEFQYEGFYQPNFTPVPDDVFDVLMAHLSGAELKVLLYIIRRTFGFKKDSDNISLSQMLNGITTRDGRVLDQGAGLSKPTLLQALRSLQDKNIIETERQRSVERGNEPTLYRLNIRKAEWGQNSIPPLDKKLYQGVDKETLPSPRTKNFTTQETVLQETVLQQSNSKTNKEKGREENHNTEPNGKTLPKHSRENGADEPESRSAYNAGKTEGTEPSQVQSVQNRKRNLRRNKEEEGIVNNFPNPATNRGLQPIASSLPMFEPEEPAINYTDARQVIQAYITDFAREFNDKAPLRSSSTRALNLMKRAGVSLDTFISRMHEARAITKESTGSIRTKSGADQYQIKAKMAYWFRVLEENLGLAEEKD